MAIPVNLGGVEATIQTVESDTKWRIAPPARTTIYQLFISLATDEGGFAIPMTQEARQQALNIAYGDLENFLHRVVEKSREIAGGSDYHGREVGFPVVVQEIAGWAVRISCECWPR